MNEWTTVWMPRSVYWSIVFDLLFHWSSHLRADFLIYCLFSTDLLISCSTCYCLIRSLLIYGSPGLFSYPLWSPDNSWPSLIIPDHSWSIVYWSLLIFWTGLLSKSAPAITSDLPRAPHLLKLSMSPASSTRVMQVVMICNTCKWEHVICTVRCQPFAVQRDHNSSNAQNHLDRFVLVQNWEGQAWNGLKQIQTCLIFVSCGRGDRWVRVPWRNVAEGSDSIESLRKVEVWFDLCWSLGHDSVRNATSFDSL